MHKNIMTKKQIEKMFNNMKNDCECVKSLYEKQIYDFETSQKQIHEYTNKYMNCLNALLLFDMIDEKIHDYAYELLNEYDAYN